MLSWQNIQFVKSQVDEMLILSDVMLTKCQVDKKLSWWNVRLT